jgi:hypothetical protein
MLKIELYMRTLDNISSHHIDNSKNMTTYSLSPLLKLWRISHQDMLLLY